MLTWPCCPRQSIDLMQSLSNTQGIFHRTRKNYLKFTWNHKDPKLPKQSWENKVGDTIKVPDFKLSITKLQWSKQYGTGTKT